MENFGAYLRTQREKKGIRLEEIASITKIHLHSLELLEGGQWEHLPPEPFIRGFIIAYAKYVGLDPKETLAQYLQELGHKVEAAVPQVESQTASHAKSGTESPNEIIENSEGTSRKKLFGVAAAALVIAVCVALTFIGKSSVDRGVHQELSNGAASESTPVAAKESSPSPLAAVKETTTTTVPETTTAPVAGAKTDLSENRGVASPADSKKESAPTAKEAAPIGVPSPVKAAPPVVAQPTAKAESTPPQATQPVPVPPGEHRVVIEAKDKVWVKVVLDEASPVQFILPGGESKTYDAKTKIKVMLGNSSAAKLTHNGEEAKGTRFQGTIRYFVFPHGARFPQDPGKRKVTSTTSEPESSENGLLSTGTPASVDKP